MIFFHHEPAIVFVQQLIEDNYNARSVLFDTTPGGGNVLIAAMRSR